MKQPFAARFTRIVPGEREGPFVYLYAFEEIQSLSCARNLFGILLLEVGRLSAVRPRKNDPGGLLACQSIGWQAQDQ